MNHVAQYRSPFVSQYRSPIGLHEDEPILVYVAEFGAQRNTVRGVATRKESGMWRANHNGNWWLLIRDEEGLVWARGWETPEANALRVMAALDK